MNIIILTEKDRISESQFSINDERFQHAKNVLKVVNNSKIEVGILNGGIGSAKIISIDETKIILNIENLKNKENFGPKIDLICALPRPQTLKKVLSISATMGVNKLFFIKSEKVEKSYFHSPLLKEENYTKFLIEGLSQGKQTKLTQVSFHHYFKKFFDKDFSDYNYKFLAHPNVNVTLKNFDIKKDDKILLAIGPEGGWNEFEIEHITNLGFNKFQLSKSILRVEHAITSSLSQMELILF
jgi:RsmE family RNA methyltransferase